MTERRIKLELPARCKAGKKETKSPWLASGIVDHLRDSHVKEQKRVSRPILCVPSYSPQIAEASSSRLVPNLARRTCEEAVDACEA